MDGRNRPRVARRGGIRRTQGISRVRRIGLLYPKPEAVHLVPVVEMRIDLDDAHRTVTLERGHEGDAR